MSKKYIKQGPVLVLGHTVLGSLSGPLVCVCSSHSPEPLNAHYCISVQLEKSIEGDEGCHGMMHTPRHKLIHNPIPTSVMCLIVLSDSPNLLSQYMSEGERFGSVGKRVHS